MCQPIPDLQTRQTEAIGCYGELEALLLDQIRPRVPYQANVVDAVVAAALGFADDQKPFRIERGLTACNREQIEIALTRLDGLLGLSRAYAMYAQHRAFTRRLGWFARLLRRA